MGSEQVLLTSLIALVDQLREDLKVHDGDWTRPGFQAIAVHRFGVFRMSIKPFVLRAPFSVTYKTLFGLIRTAYGIELPYTVSVGRRVVIEHQGAIVIHGNAVIGDDTIIRQGVTIGNKNRKKPFDAPVIGQGVNIGAGAKILGKIVVGDCSTIGANAVVVRDVEAKTTVGGVPAVVLRRASAPPSCTDDSDI
jgi:serine O-acetyltransferase